MAIHFHLPKLGKSGGIILASKCIEARAAAKHPTTYKTMEADPAQSANTAKVEKPNHKQCQQTS